MAIGATMLACSLYVWGGIPRQAIKTSRGAVSIEIIDKPSPNFGDRPTGHKITMLVLHYTGMKSCDEALDRLCSPEVQVSAHLLVDEDGTVFRLVDDEKRAWHAGHGYWRGVTDVNSASIGIELVNPGHEFGYRAFPPPQIDVLSKICSNLVADYDIAPSNVVGHSDIAPSRKQDPGELFPWQHLAERGIGLWPDESLAPPPHGTTWDELMEIGYTAPGEGGTNSAASDMPVSEADVVMAFQRRFLPDNLTGVLDAVTATRISAVRQEYAKSLI